MRLRKNVFGYINFSIGALIMSVYLYTLFVSLLRSFEEKAGRRILIMGVKLSNILGVFLLIASVLIILLILFLKSKIPVKSFKGAGLIYNIIYWCLFAFFLSYGYFARTRGLGVLKKWETIKHYTESVSKPGYWQNLLDTFYGHPTSYDNFFHKAYTYIAALFLKIFGDTLTVPVYLNIILYILSSVLLFFSVKFIFGKVPALVTFGALLLTKAPIAFSLEISGFNLFFLALSLLFFLVTYFLDVFTETKPVMCYIVSSVTVALAIVINHFAFKPFIPVFAFDLSVLKFRPSEIIYVSIAIAFLSLFGYICFFKNKKDEISFANILLVVLLLILMFDYSANNTYLFTIISFCILAGIGLDNLLFRHYKEAADYDEFAFESEEKEEDSLVSSVSSVDVPVSDLIPQEISESLSEEPEDTGVITVSNLVGARPEEEPKEAPVESQEKEEVPRQFETPLPMPKKHVKKSFDYSYKLTEDMMKYDIEISPDDDFDIK